MDIKLKVEILEKLNYALSKVSLSHFRWIGTTTNLKMHDAFSYACDESDESLFEEWCHESFYQEYLPTLRRLNMEEETIGFSSSFRFKSKDTELTHVYDLHAYENESEKARRLMVFEEFIYSQFRYFSFVSSDFKQDHIVGVKSIEDQISYQMDNYRLSLDECLEELEFPNLTKEELAHEFENFCKEELKDLNRMYDFLQDFSENQVELFKGFIGITEDSQD